MELLIKTCRVTAWLIWVIALKVIYNIEIHIGGQIVAGDVGGQHMDQISSYVSNRPFRFISSV